MIIAIDFDGTIVNDKFPEIGVPLIDAIHTIKELKTKGHQLILWTCRRDIPGDRNYLTEAIAFLKKFDIEFDAVNSNIQAHIDFWGGDTRKVFADIYIDDKNLVWLSWKQIRYLLITKSIHQLKLEGKLNMDLITIEGEDDKEGLLDDTD